MSSLWGKISGSKGSGKAPFRRVCFLQPFSVKLARIVKFGEEEKTCPTGEK